MKPKLGRLFSGWFEPWMTMPEFHGYEDLRATLLAYLLRQAVYSVVGELFSAVLGAEP